MIEMELNGASWRCLDPQACWVTTEDAVSLVQTSHEARLPGTKVGTPYVRISTHSVLRFSSDYSLCDL